MRREAAKKLIRDTFERPFDKEQFTVLVKNLLNRLDPATFTYRGNSIWEDFRERVKSLERIGKYQDNDGNKIDILIVHLVKETSLERARATQRKVVAKYLNGSRGNELKDAALVAFVSPNEEDWRFSFVKMDYRLETTAKGHLKVKEEFTPARRYSFLVGRNENSHTAQARLLPILEATDTDPSLADFEEAFGIERVTKEFFQQYRELYHTVKDTLDKVVSEDKEIKSEFESKCVDTIDFAKKLLGQIVFLYFLQKKGWFGVKRKAAWGTGSKNFLRELFRGDHGDYRNFFNDILEPLFYNTLAVERQENYADRFDCKIPFLNGGLFDPLNDYDWVNTDILLPNELFSNSTKTKAGDVGTGILDVFDRFNFTVKEDEPLEKEVAVDPEMLGKVFENLLEVKDRKSKGTYYTPREIVHYMCQESLINHLATELEGRVAREDIETLIKHGETALENDALVVQHGEERGRYKYRLPESVRKHAKHIDQSLAGIKVCDPAVGSGAFLVGMMSEIVRTRMVLTQFLGNGERTAYNLKRHAIQNSLYGVDFDLGAVEIAKLRLWLSLIVDEDDYRQIKPLPNLDYKIMQGNSLLEEYEGIKLINERFFEKQEEKATIRQRLERDQSKLQREYIQLNADRKLTKTKKAELEKNLKEIDKTLRELDKPRSNGQDELGLYGKSEVRSKADKLLDLHELFFSAYNKRQKDQLKKQIDALTWDLIEATLNQQDKSGKLEDVRRFQQTNTRPFFLWRLNFADVFNDNRGFDIVIANPPYIRQESLPFKELYSQVYATYHGMADLYTYFIERGMNILKSGGYFTYIVSNRFTHTNYGRALREYLSNKNLVSLIDLNGLAVFDNANVDTCILSATNATPDESPVYIHTKSDHDTRLLSFNELISSYSSATQKRYLGKTPWSFHDTEILDLKQKIVDGGTALSAIKNLKVNRGITTGLNKVFIINEDQRQEIIRHDKASDDLIIPILKGGHIKRWRVNWFNTYLIFTQTGVNIQKYPGLLTYLFRYKRQLSNVWEARQNKKKWYELRPCSYYNAFSEDKIVYTRLSNTNAFALSHKTEFCVDSAGIIVSDDNKYYAAILNSRVVLFYFKQVCVIWGKDGMKWFGGGFDSIPIHVIQREDSKEMSIRDRIVKLVEQIEKAIDEGCLESVPKFEAEIDTLVYQLYGLDSKEIEIVEG